MALAKLNSIDFEGWKGMREDLQNLTKSCEILRRLKTSKKVDVGLVNLKNNYVDLKSQEKDTSVLGILSWAVW